MVLVAENCMLCGNNGMSSEKQDSSVPQIASLSSINANYMDMEQKSFQDYPPPSYNPVNCYPSLPPDFSRTTAPPPVPPTYPYYQPSPFQSSTSNSGYVSATQQQNPYLFHQSASSPEGFYISSF